MPDVSIGIFRADNKRKLVVFLGVFLLLAFMSTMIASFFVSRGAIWEAISSRELPLTSDNIYSEIQNDLLLPLYISSTMANDTFLREWVIDGEKDVSKISNYLSEIKNKYGTVSSFFVSEKTKRYYIGEGILKTIQMSEPRDKWYFRVQQMDNLYEINVDPDLANRDAITIFINYKVFDFSNRYIGATGVGLTVNTLKARIEDYQRRFQRNVFFIDKNGVVVLQHQEGAERLREGKNIKNISGLSDVASRVLSQKNGSFKYQMDESTVFLSSRYIPEINWYLMVEQNVEKAIQPLRNILYVNIAIGLIVTVVVLVTISFMVLRFQKNLETRNLALENKNRQINEQRRQLEVQTNDLAEVNQQLAHLNREKDEFLGIAAHDLRSPLSGIIAAIELIKGEESAEEKRAYEDYIARTATDMLDLITNLLDISAIEMTKELEKIPVDIIEVISKTITSFDIHAKTKQITIRSVLPESPIYVSTHLEWLNNIISNLISNAIKYSPEQTTVDITLLREAGYARLLVEDRGPGLSVEDKKILFSRFARLSPEPTGGESSSGLGLYIVKKLTERLGGNVWCESEYGVGSTFIVELPLSHLPETPLA